MPVRIALDSAHTFRGETDSVRLLTTGQLFREGSGFTLIYGETGMDMSCGLITMMTRLTCGNDRVSLERSEPDYSTMIFDKQGQYTCQDGGEEYMGEGFRLVANNVDYHLGDADGRINLSFSIMGDYDPGKYDIDIKFAKQKPKPRRRAKAC
jgi:hypothetical protein